MYLVALPLSTTEAAALRVLTLPHRLLDLTRGLEAGQLLIGMDDDGAYWGLTVEAIRFTADDTHYVFVLGSPVEPWAVAALRPERLAPGVMPGEVVLGLRALATHALEPLSA